MSESMLQALNGQANAIYDAYVQGNKSTARAMLNQIPHKRTAYVVMVMVAQANVSEEPLAMNRVWQLVSSVTS